MITNAQIKLIRSLREKKYREQEKLFIVEGEKMVSEALNSSFDVVEVFRQQDIGSAAMERISLQSSSSPVLALVRIPEPEELPSPKGLCLALDNLRDPGNLGTIVRLADWFGIEAIYASMETVELYNPKTVQATMGAVFRKKILRCDIASLCRDFRSAGLEVFGTFMNGENIYGSDLTSEGLIVMGNESLGISPEVEREVSRRITIPNFVPGGSSESLNVAIATAITVSEFRRR